MSRFVPLACALVLGLCAPAPAAAQATAPVDVGPNDAGGAAAGLVASEFSVSPGRVVAGAPVTIAFSVQSTVPKVRARVTLGDARLVLRGVPTGAAFARRWIPSVAAGEYRAKLVVRSGGMKRVRTFPVTVAPAPTPPPVAANLVSGGVFPIKGEYSFGGEDARFGAARDGHVHQGQDVTAAFGTPIVSPVTGSIYWRKVQEGGAGHYLIVRDAAGADYVFMHLAAGSELVEKGDPVRAGQPIAQVGSTGSSSGPHLHFEIWPGGWYAPGSQPIDPLPQLRAWAAR